MGIGSGNFIWAIEVGKLGLQFTMDLRLYLIWEKVETFSKAKKIKNKVLFFLILFATFACKEFVLGSAATTEATFVLTYQYTVREIPQNANKLFVWIPIPPSNKWQKLEKFNVQEEIPYEVVTDLEYHNQFIRFDL